MAYNQNQLIELGISLGEIKSELEELRKRNKFLEEQNKQLTDALIAAAKQPALTVPSTPYRKCLICGSEGVVGYVCTRNDCPTVVR